MKVVLLQTDIVWGEPERNLALADEAMSRQPGADLYVLPEMFTTGFATQEGARIDENPDRTVSWMQDRAKTLDCAIAGSIAMKDGDKLVNRLHFVTPDGNVAVYDKRHLFTYGGEHHRFTAGHKRVVVEFRGVKFLLLVCYDLRFPVWARSKGDYDAIILVANWPTPRQTAWETLIRARAIENQCYMLAVNRAGQDPVCDYTGGSTLYNPYGISLARCEDNKAGEAMGEIDMKMLEDYRAKFPVMDDEDIFDLK